LRPTPHKAHYTFSWRDCRKIVNSMQMIESNYLKKEQNVMKLFYHECLRTYGDRLLMTHDKSWFIASLNEVCREYFDVVDESDEEFKKIQEGKFTEEYPSQLNEYLDKKKQFLWPIEDPANMYFSHWNNEVEGFYMEVDRVDEIEKIIEGNLDRFNDSNERVRIDLMLYNQLSRQMLKMLRILSAPNGHLLNISMKGFGMNIVVKLVSFAAGHTLREIEMHEQFTDDEWKSELRQALIVCATEDKPLTFFIDEYKIKKDQWYSDLESLLKNSFSSDITRKNDIMSVLCEIQSEVEDEKQGMKVGMSAADIARQKLTAEAAAGQPTEEQNKKADDDVRRVMQKFPFM
jgi:dynein heavy chain